MTRLRRKELQKNGKVGCNLRVARNAYGFFDFWYGVRAELGGQGEKSFRLRHLTVNLHRAQEAIPVGPAVESTVFQYRKFGTRLLVTFLQKTVVVRERYLDEHFHDAKVKQSNVASQCPRRCGGGPNATRPPRVLFASM